MRTNLLQLGAFLWRVAFPPEPKAGGQMCHLEIHRGRE